MTEIKKVEPIKILVVEDDMSMRESVVFKLRKAGFMVDEVDNGPAGIEKLRLDSLYGGILLDMRLPQKDGFWFLEEKNKYPQLHEIPVLMFSNVGEMQMIKHALDLGANGFMIKAIHSIDEIVERVRKCFLEGSCETDYA